MVEPQTTSAETQARLTQQIAAESDPLRKAGLLLELIRELSQPPADYARARTSAEQALHLVGGLPETPETQHLTAQAFSWLAQASYFLRDYADVAPKAQACLKLALKISDHAAESRAANALALVLAQSGDTAGAARLFEQSIAAAQTANDLPAIARGNYNFGKTLFDTGEFEQALEHYDRAREVYERLNQTLHVAICQESMGAVYGEMGDWEKAVEYSYRALVEHEKLQYKLGMCVCYLNISVIYAKRNNYERAIQCAETAERLAREVEDPNCQIVARRCMAEAHHKLGDFVRARSIYDENIKAARALNLPDLEAENLRCKAELLLLTAEPGETASHAREAIELLQQGLRLLEQRGSSLARAQHHDVLGQAYALVGEPEQAAACFEAAIKAITPLRKSLELAKTHFNYGRFLVEQGQREHGLALVEEAAKTFRRLEVITESETAERYLLQMNIEHDPRLSLLRSLSALTSHSLPLSEFAPRCLQVLRDALGFSSATFFVEEGRPYLLGPPCSEDELDETRKGELFLRASSLFLPLRLSGRNVGGIYLRWIPGTGGQTAGPRAGLLNASFLEIVANLLSVAMERNRAQPALVETLIGEEVPCAVPTVQTTRYPGFIGNAANLPEIFETIEQVAPTNACVLIRGESGTGKEVIARIIRQRSNRAEEPFVALNCAALPETLLEAELFGIEKGVATGVVERKGKFEQAHRGTLFLDEIGDMSVVLQTKLLRVLQDHCFERVGGRKTIQVDTRILAATNKDLEKAIEEGTFRADLYYRLNVISISLPPLRQRLEDLPLLVNHFIQQYNEEFGRRIRGVAPDVLNALLEYSWPGNIRELRNVIERAVILCRTDLIQVQSLPPALQQIAARLSESGAGTGVIATISDVRELRKKAHSETTAIVEKNLIVSALRDNHGNAAKAARQLNISRTHLYRLLEKYGLKRTAGTDSVEPAES